MSDQEILENAITLAQSGNFDRANSLFSQLVPKYRGHVALVVAYARSLGLSNDFALANEQLQGLITFHGPSATLLMEIARCQEEWNRYDLALDTWSNAANMADAPAGTWIEVARVSERLNRVEEATEALQRAIGKGVHSAARLAVEGRLAFRTADLALAERCYEELSQRASAPELRQQGFLGLAKVAEQRGEYARAWDAITKAKSQRQAEAEALKNAHPLPQYESNWDFLTTAEEEGGENRHAFLLGFPRSGTSLAGRLLSRQQGVTYADETLVGTTTLNLLHPLERPSSWRAKDRKIARAHYRNRIGQLTKLAKGNLLLDKNPALSLWAPGFASLFPAAKIVWCHRDPRDVFMSCLTTDFPLNPFTCHFYTTEDLVALIKGVDRIQHKLQAVIPQRFQLCSYETLAGAGKIDPDILAFLGLSPTEDPSTELPGYINSPTYFEVIQPITTNRVGRWEGYMPWLEESFDRLLRTSENMCEK